MSESEIYKKELLGMELATADQDVKKIFEYQFTGNVSEKTYLKNAIKDIKYIIQELKAVFSYKVYKWKWPQELERFAGMPQEQTIHEARQNIHKIITLLTLELDKIPRPDTAEYKIISTANQKLRDLQRHYKLN